MKLRTQYLSAVLYLHSSSPTFVILSSLFVLILVFSDCPFHLCAPGMHLSFSAWRTFGSYKLRIFHYAVIRSDTVQFISQYQNGKLWLVDRHESIFSTIVRKIFGPRRHPPITSS